MPGLLETVRCIAGEAPLLWRHQERLARSWSSWFRGVPPDLAEVAGAAIAASRGGSSLVRISCLRVAPDRAPRVEVESRPLPSVPSPLRVALAGLPRSEPPEERCHKQADRRWVTALSLPGVDETLVWDDDHGLLEGTRSNLFVLKGTTLVTPAIECGLVPGVVRAELVAAAPSLGLDLVEATVAPIDLATCDALLLTGCGIGVAAAHECDGRAIGTASGRARAAELRAKLLPGG